MNNYCRNCGQKLELGQKECSCGAVVIEKRIDIEKRKEEIAKVKKKEKIYLITIACLILSAMALNSLSNYLNLDLGAILGLLFLGAFISIITARVNCSESKVIRTLFAILIIYIAIQTIFSALTIIACFGWLRYGCP